MLYSHDIDTQNLKIRMQGGGRGLLRYGRLHNRLPNLWMWIIISRVISSLWNFILVAWKLVPWQWNKCYIVEMQNYTQNMQNMRNMKEVLHCLLPKTICRICSIWRICKIRPICHDILQYVLYQLNAEYAKEVEYAQWPICYNM
jgi:hypothetical protein